MPKPSRQRAESPTPNPTTPEPVPDARRFSTRAGWLVGLSAFAGIALLLIATGPSLAIVWDEGFTMGREERIRMWLSALRDPQGFAARWEPPHPLEELVQPDGRRPPRADQLDTRAELFERETLEWFWPFAREEPHGHPPFYAIVGLVGDVLAPSWEQLPRARLGPMLVFATVGGGLAAFALRRWGPWSAAAAVGAWALQPRMFAHAHYAHYDAILTSLWMAAILTFTLAVERPAGAPRRPRWGWAVAFGVLLGCAAGIKLTGWFVVLPFLAWTLIYRDRRAALTLLVGGFVAALTLYAIVPPWWGDPVGGVTRFLESNLTRAQTTRIPTLFLGEIILTPKDSLPWYNTLVWTVFVTPVGFLTLALLGIVRGLRLARSEPLGLLALGHWVFLLILRALPHTPGHDAERQFLAAFGILALVAAMGAAEVVGWVGRWGRALVAAAIAEGAVSIALMMPVPLSYYSPAVGWLPGAMALGMEPTYYWDALTPEALDWLNRNTSDGEKVVFPTNPTTWIYLNRSGQLRPPAMFWQPGTSRWYVVQNRVGALGPEDRALIDRLGPDHVLVQKWGVPLVYVFPYEEIERERARLDGVRP